MSNIYFDFKTWFSLLKENPGLEGLQQRNSKLYLFTIEGSEKLWMRDINNEDPRVEPSSTLEEFEEQRLEGKVKYKYWFELEKLIDYGLYHLLPTVEEVLDSW